MNPLATEKRRQSENNIEKLIKERTLEMTSSIGGKKPYVRVSPPKHSVEHGPDNELIES